MFINFLEFPSLNIATLGVKVLTYQFEGDVNIQSITESSGIVLFNISYTSDEAMNLEYLIIFGRNKKGNQTKISQKFHPNIFGIAKISTQFEK